jgi:hypothetical protein
MDVAARTVELALDATGFLVTQRAGVEHPTRAHWLLLGRSRKLKTIWSADEGGAPSTMTTRVLPTGTSHHNDIAVIETYTPPLEAADKLLATRLHLEPSTGAIVKSALPDSKSSLFLLRVGQFKTAEEAYNARGSDGCLAPFGVLQASLFPGLNVREFFLGMVLARREDAAVLVGNSGECARAPKPALIEYAARR